MFLSTYIFLIYLSRLGGAGVILLVQAKKNTECVNLIVLGRFFLVFGVSLLISFERYPAHIPIHS